MSRRLSAVCAVVSHTVGLCAGSRTVMLTCGQSPLPFTALCHSEPPFFFRSGIDAHTITKAAGCPHHKYAVAALKEQLAVAHIINAPSRRQRSRGQHAALPLPPGVASNAIAYRPGIAAGPGLSAHLVRRQQRGAMRRRGAPRHGLWARAAAQRAARRLAPVGLHRRLGQLREALAAQPARAPTTRRA